MLLCVLRLRPAVLLRRCDITTTIEVAEMSSAGDNLEADDDEDVFAGTLRLGSSSCTAS